MRGRLLCLVGEAVLPGDALAGDAFVDELLGVFVPRVARVLCVTDFALAPLPPLTCSLASSAAAACSSSCSCFCAKIRIHRSAT